MPLYPEKFNPFGPNPGKKWVTVEMDVDDVSAVGSVGRLVVSVVSGGPKPETPLQRFKRLLDEASQAFGQVTITQEMTRTGPSLVKGTSLLNQAIQALKEVVPE